MLRIGILAREQARFAAVIAASAVVFAGCSTPYMPVEPADDEPSEIVFEPPITELETKPLARIPRPPGLPPVAIVLTSSQPAYADVARELTRHFKKYEIYDLSDASRPPVSVLRAINDSNSGAVVAIGLRAARSSVAMADKPVVFSQVFNYQEHELLQENSRGVDVLAPLDAQIAAWKDIDPAISRIGAIVGEGHEELMAKAKLAAERHGLDLRVQVTHSDQETLYVFRRMIRDIDGFWLFPDNRVLSTRVLEQMLADANRQQVPVTVPSESMLQLGAMISMSAVASDIAATIVKVVRQIHAGGLEHVPPITPLSEIRVATKDTIRVAGR